MKWFFIDTSCECGAINDENKIFDEDGTYAERSDVEKIIKQRDELLDILRLIESYDFKPETSELTPIGRYMKMGRLARIAINKAEANK